MKDKIKFVKKNGDTIQVYEKKGQITIGTLNPQGRELTRQRIFLDMEDTAPLIKAIQSLIAPGDPHVETIEMGKNDNFPQHRKTTVMSPPGTKNDLSVSGYLLDRRLFITTLDWKGEWEKVVFTNIPNQLSSTVCAEYAAILYALDAQIRQDPEVDSLNVISTGKCSVFQMKGVWQTRDDKSYFPYYKRLVSYWEEDWMDSELVYEPCDGNHVRAELEKFVEEFTQDPDSFEPLDFKRKFPCHIPGSTYPRQERVEQEFQTSIHREVGTMMRELRQDDDIPF